MLKNYFKIAWRNIIKNRFYSAVNIIGLSAGILFTIVIAACMYTQLKVNADIKNLDQQYIIQSQWRDPGEGTALTSTGPLAAWLKQQYPSLVKNYYRADLVTSNVSKGDKAFREGIQIGDSTMLNMFGYPLLHGNAATALTGPFKLVITEDKAMKYFGSTDVVGQTLSIQDFSGGQHDFVITGVMKLSNDNTVFHAVRDFDNRFFVSNDNLTYFGRNMDWGNQSILSFIELQPGANPANLSAPMKQLIKNNTSPEIVKDLTPYLMPLKTYYLDTENKLVRKMLTALSAIAAFILLMAIINFINMSVSRSVTRMREMGIRKVLGGLRKQLIMQFLLEANLIVFIAAMFAFIVYGFTKNLFGFILDVQMPSLSSFPFYYLLLPIIFVLMVGLLAGIYPALVLSSLKSVESLKGRIGSVKENVLLRKSLVGFQFATAAIVFVAAIIISKQVQLFFSKGLLGYDQNYIITAQLPRNWTEEGVQKMETVRKQFAAMPQVSNVTLSYEIPDGGNSGHTLMWKQGSDSTAGVLSTFLICDEYYAATYKIQMTAGIFFGRPGAVKDSMSVVINETQAKMFGWANPAEAIGKKVIYASDQPPVNIAGVVKDFHSGNMQQTLKPVTFAYVGIIPSYRYLSFKINPGNISSTMNLLQKKWNELMPGSGFDYHFMDEKLSSMYKSELQLKKAAFTGGVLALIIVLLGVLGLVALSIQKRTKEIGIRKILGASVPGIITLLMKEFVWVIVIASLAACPVAYIIMHNWLQGYAYRIDITAEPFIIATAILALITATLIIIQTIKTANANPIKSLRTE